MRLTCKTLLFFSFCLLVVASANAVVTIKNVVLSDGNTAIVDSSLASGDKVYSDRDYTFGEVPEKYLGLPFIMMPMNSSKNPIKPGLEVSFEIDKEAYVYLLWATKEPPREWLTDEYINTDEVIFMGEDMQQWATLQERQIWRSEEPFKPGKVTTYDVMQDAAIYIILVEEAVSGMEVLPGGKLTTIWGMLKLN